MLCTIAEIIMNELHCIWLHFEDHKLVSNVFYKYTQTAWTLQIKTKWAIISAEKKKKRKGGILWGQNVRDDLYINLREGLSEFNLRKTNIYWISKHLCSCRVLFVNKTFECLLKKIEHLLLGPPPFLHEPAKTHLPSLPVTSQMVNH